MYSVIEYKDLKSGISIIGQLLARQDDGCILLIDNFAEKIGQEEDEQEEFNTLWTILFQVLGCSTITIPQSIGNCKVFIKTAGDGRRLKDLGFSGVLISDSESEHTCYLASEGLADKAA